MWNVQNKEKHLRRFVGIATFIFSVAAIFHLLRIINSWTVQLGSLNLPMKVSWFALIAAIFMVLMGFGYLKR